MMWLLIFLAWLVIWAGGTYWYLFGKKSPFSLESVRPPGPREFDQKKRDKVIKQGFSLDKVPQNLDVIVIGSGIGGLTAAATLAKAGRRVLLLEQHDQAGGCCHTLKVVPVRSPSTSSAPSRNMEETAWSELLSLGSCGCFKLWRLQHLPETSSPFIVGIQERLNMMKHGRGSFLVFSGFDGTQEELGLESTNFWLWTSFCLVLEGVLYLFILVCHVLMLYPALGLGELGLQS